MRDFTDMEYDYFKKEEAFERQRSAQDLIDEEKEALVNLIEDEWPIDTVHELMVEYAQWLVNTTSVLDDGDMQDYLTIKMASIRHFVDAEFSER